MKKEFQRGLNDKTCTKVKIFFDETDVGKTIKERPELDICIRDNYINVYNNGCSILKYCPNATTNIFNIHQKYLPQKIKDQKYAHLELKNGDLTTSPKTDFSFLHDIILEPNEKLKVYVEAEKNRKHGEKKYISDYLRNTESQPFMLDLEIAYSKEGAGTKKGSAPRIDLSCIDPASNTLQFIEVKTLSDSRVRLGKSHIDADLRDCTKEGFEVHEQINGYKKFLVENIEQIQSSYRKIAQNYINIGLANRFPSGGGFSGREILEKFSREGTINSEPFLLLFLDGAKRKGKYGDNIEALKHSFENFQEFPDRYLFHKIKSPLK